MTWHMNNLGGHQSRKSKPCRKPELHPTFQILEEREMMTTAIGDYYLAHGGAAGFLGPALEVERIASDNQGHFQHFKNGSVYWSPVTREAHAVTGGIDRKVNELGLDKVGYPIMEQPAPLGRGLYGTPIEDEFYNPTTHVYTTIVWNMDASSQYGNKAFAVAGDFRSDWKTASSNTMEYWFPTSDVGYTTDGAARFQNFVDLSNQQKLAIYSTADTGTHYLRGEVLKKWQELNQELYARSINHV